MTKPTQDASANAAHECVRGGPARITRAECGCQKCLEILELERDFYERHFRNPYNPNDDI